MDQNKARQNAWDAVSEEQYTDIMDINRGYIQFLNAAKTEREALQYIIRAARQKGFIPIEQVEKIEPGQKLIFQYRNKVCGLLIIGKQELVQGFNLVVSHIDTPRLDLKPKPVYEADGLALFKTHYYGGIKKYQWPAIPLALHGVVVKKDGTVVTITLGENEGDPVLTISDLLPHLAKDQMEKKMAEGIKGEDLNIIIGSRPRGQEKDSIKARILDIFKEQYDIEEDDFTSAELQAVPAFKASDVGLDRSMVGAYGQDDRVSAFTSLEAVLQVSDPQRTALCLFVDKEEIGSSGNTGLQSLLIENLAAEVLHKAGIHDYYMVRKALAGSYALSADVNAAVDPTYPEVFEKMNCSFISAGVVLTKYTGSRGKYDSNDANPEFVAAMRRLFDEHQVVWQVGELGKVDIGGGGTVAQYMARYGMEVVDCGVAVLGMHSPFEVVSKADVFMACQAYKAFLQSYI